MTVNRDRPSFEARPTSAAARAAGLGDVSVTVRHVPTASIFMLSAADARAMALCILKAVDEAEGWPLFTRPVEEPTRKQCRKCLKDCAACSCVEDVISRGKGV